jgi:hypothetical protein
MHDNGDFGGGGDFDGDGHPDHHGHFFGISSDFEGVLGLCPLSQTPSSCGLVKGQENIEVHIPSHSPCDVRYKLLELLDSFDLLKIDTFRPNLMAERKKSERILPDNAWEEGGRNPNLPSQWYPGATGSTLLWKEFFHIGKRATSFLGFKGKLLKNFESRLYLEVSCVTRSYVETGDCQTDIVIWVRPLHFWSGYQQNWQYDEYWFMRHFQVAEALGFKIFTTVAMNYAPRPEAKQIRDVRRAPSTQSPPPPVPAGKPDGIAGGGATGSGRDAGITPPVRPPEPPPWVDKSERGDMSGANIDKLFPPGPGDNGYSPPGGAGSGG